MNLRGLKHYRDRQNINRDLSKRLLQFERDSTDFITTYFLNENTDARGGRLTARKKLEIFLRYVSDPGYQNGVNDIRVKRSTISKTFSSVLDMDQVKTD